MPTGTLQTAAKAVQKGRMDRLGYFVSDWLAKKSDKLAELMPPGAVHDALDAATGAAVLSENLFLRRLLRK